MQSETELEARISGSYLWLVQVLGQILDGAPTEVDMTHDPMAVIRGIDALREGLEDAGIPVPAIVHPDEDPLGNMMAWRDFLALLVTVH